MGLKRKRSRKITTLSDQDEAQIKPAKMMRLQRVECSKSENFAMSRRRKDQKKSEAPKASGIKPEKTKGKGKKDSKIEQSASKTQRKLRRKKMKSEVRKIETSTNKPGKIVHREVKESCPIDQSESKPQSKVRRKTMRSEIHKIETSTNKSGKTVPREVKEKRQIDQSESKRQRKKKNTKVHKKEASTIKSSRIMQRKVEVCQTVRTSPKSQRKESKSRKFKKLNSEIKLEKTLKRKVKESIQKEQSGSESKLQIKRKRKKAESRKRKKIELKSPKTSQCRKQGSKEALSSENSSISKSDEGRDKFFPVYYACKFSEDEVITLIKTGCRFYEYLQEDKDLWKEYVANMDEEDKDYGRPDYLNRRYSHGREELHTTMFFGSNPAELATYEERPAVELDIGKPIELEIFGVMVTTSTLGFRIRLPSSALPLWLANDNGPEIHPMGKTAMLSALRKFCHDRLANPNGQFSPGNFKLGSRAHATVLTNSRTRPVQTGLDLIDVMHCEEKCVKNSLYRPVNLGPGWSAKMRYYGFGRFVFYLDEPVRVCSTFLRFQ